MVARYSKVFDRMINNGMKESVERKASLPEVEADVFAQFAAFLYRQWCSGQPCTPVWDEIWESKNIQVCSLSWLMYPCGSALTNWFAGSLHQKWLYQISLCELQYECKLSASSIVSTLPEL